MYPDATFPLDREINFQPLPVLILIWDLSKLQCIVPFSPIIFVSLTNKTLDLPKNVISAGINSTSQFNTIKKFLETNQIQRTIFLTPIQDYEFEVKRGMKNSKIKIYKDYEYNTEPTKLTKQIEEITNYRIRKQNLEDEIKRIKNSNDPNKEKKIEQLKKFIML